MTLNFLKLRQSQELMASVRLEEDHPPLVPLLLQLNQALLLEEVLLLGEVLLPEEVLLQVTSRNQLPLQ